MAANVVVKKGSGKPFVEYEDVWQSANARLKDYDEQLRDSGAPDIYVGVSSGPNGTRPILNIDNSAAGYSNTTKPNAYRANVAGTASSIKQGGMTKDEIIDFNLRHPNETMMRGQ